MRDYSFGNFISALRERAGLSQYQLGALVGVTDKAVSKWENGASKPRIGIIRKLSEVLDVGVDELLTCEYDTFNKDRKDLFAMRNDIISIAKNKMHELYGENPPIRIVNRFKTEELMLEGQEVLLWMGFFGKLQEKFRTEDLYFDVRIAQMGASFIAWLLGGTTVNPLPVHYYCPVCKQVEFISGERCGIDLPDKKCVCGSCYQKDGFGIDSTNMYPFQKWQEISVSNNGTELVKNCMKEYFSEYGELRELRVKDEESECDFSEQFKMTKFILLSNGIKKQFPDNVIIVSPEEYWKIMKDGSGLTIVENKEEQLCIQDILNTEVTSKHIKAFFKYAAENGRFINEFSGVDLRKVLPNIQTPKFATLLSIDGLLHGTGVWENNAEYLYDNGISLEELISCREDVYDFLYDKLRGKCCDNPSGLVFEIKEAVRKGRYERKGMPTDMERLLLSCDVPEWYVESMKKILYLFPKTHLITIAKRDICEFIKMNKE